MVFKSFANWLLWLVAGGLVVGGLIAGAVFGFFGTEIQDSITALFEPLAEAAVSNSEKLVMFGKALGAFTTVCTGLFGLHKALFFAERQLPNRLGEYIKKKLDQKIVGERDVLLAGVNSANLNRPANSDQLYKEVGTTLAVLEPALASWRKQNATLDYLEGHRKSLLADQRMSTGQDGEAHKLRAEAVDHFEKAGQADRDDLRAWEYAAEQAEKILDHDRTINAWERLAIAHEERGNRLNQASALERDQLR